MQIDNIEKSRQLDGDRIKGIYDISKGVDKAMDSLNERCIEGFAMTTADFDSKFYKIYDNIVGQNNKIDQITLVQGDLTTSIDEAVRRFKQIKKHNFQIEETIENLKKTKMNEKDFTSTMDEFRIEHEVIIKRVMFNEYET